MKDQFAGGDDPLLERKYYLTCKLKFFVKNIKDWDGKQEVNRRRTLAFLIPQESDERIRFLSAWLPETDKEYFELAAYISSPVDSPCRLAIKRADGQCERHYLTVMSVGVEEIMLNHMKDGQMVQVTILPVSEEQETDFARDVSDQNFDVQGQ